MKIILITGASSGIGYTTAKELAEQGNIVYGAARRVEQIKELEALGVKPIFLDLTDSQAITSCVEQIINAEGKIDILINNAGYGSYGPLETVAIDEAKRQFEVNIFGLANLTQAVLPYMRENGQGRIINISSIGGRLVTYLGGWYHATKYALEAYSDALRMEVSEFGIDVVIIEPGGIKTEWAGIAADHLCDNIKGTVYEQNGQKIVDSMRKYASGDTLSDPQVITTTISKAINKRKPKPRYIVGYAAKPLVFLKTILPTKTFDILMKNAN